VLRYKDRKREIDKEKQRERETDRQTEIEKERVGVSHGLVVKAERTHDQGIVSSNPGTVYWMDISDASYHIHKNKGSQMGHTKKIIKKRKRDRQGETERERQTDSSRKKDERNNMEKQIDRQTDRNKKREKESHRDR
jgi:hypothetical protein